MWDWSGCCGFSLSSFGFGNAPVVAEAVLSSLRDIAMKCKTIGRHRSYLGITKHPGQRGEDEVSGDDDAGMPVKFEGQMEEQSDEWDCFILYCVR